MNELSNQFEYLSCLTETQRTTALTQLQLSSETQRCLANANLGADLFVKEDGTRLTLSLDWDRGAHAKPVQLTGWLSSSVTDLPATETQKTSPGEDSNETT
jgi:hypothetical protein